jgi:hypothetical protein
MWIKISFACIVTILFLKPVFNLFAYFISFMYFHFIVKENTVRGGGGGGGGGAGRRRGAQVRAIQV